MGSFTRVYMSATFPEHSALESVGSVAANFARTPEEEQGIDFKSLFPWIRHDKPNFFLLHPSIC